MYVSPSKKRKTRGASQSPSSSVKRPKKKVAELLVEEDILEDEPLDEEEDDYNDEEYEVEA